MIHVLILLPLKLSSLNIFFLKLSERAKGNRYRYSFLSVDTMCDPCFPELSLDGVMQYCLPYNMWVFIKTTDSWECSCSLWCHKHSPSSCKSCRYIADGDIIYRPDFLLETIMQLIPHWWKIKNILNKIFNNPLFKIMFPCARTKILFIEYKYFLIKSKYILLNTNIFPQMSNIFYWIWI